MRRHVQDSQLRRCDHSVCNIHQVAARRTMLDWCARLVCYAIIISWLQFATFQLTTLPTLHNWHPLALAARGPTKREHLSDLLLSQPSFPRVSSGCLRSPVSNFASVSDSCTEFGYYQTGVTPAQPFSPRISLQFFRDICRDTFGPCAQFIFASSAVCNDELFGFACSDSGCAGY